LDNLQMRYTLMQELYHKERKNCQQSGDSLLSKFRNQYDHIIEKLSSVDSSICEISQVIHSNSTSTENTPETRPLTQSLSIPKLLSGMEDKYCAKNDSRGISKNTFKMPQSNSFHCEPSELVHRLRKAMKKKNSFDL
jgi:hypothetical protein